MVQCKVDYLQSSQASPLDVLDALEIQNKSNFELGEGE